MVVEKVARGHWKQVIFNKSKIVALSAACRGPAWAVWPIFSSISFVFTVAGGKIVCSCSTIARWRTAESNRASKRRPLCLLPVIYGSQTPREARQEVHLASLYVEPLSRGSSAVLLLYCATVPIEVLDFLELIFFSSENIRWTVTPIAVFMKIVLTEEKNC